MRGRSDDGFEAGPTLRTTSFVDRQLAVTRLTSIGPRLRLCEPLPVEDSYLCELHLKALAHHELWRHGRRTLKRSYAKDSVRIIDLRDELRVYIRGSFDVLSFHIPRAVIDECSDLMGGARIAALSCRQGAHDPMLARLGQALLPAITAPATASKLFVEHVLLAVNAHVLRRYGRQV
jgi:AraC family transcriptional regulator